MCDADLFHLMGVDVSLADSLLLEKRFMFQYYKKCFLNLKYICSCEKV